MYRCISILLVCLLALLDAPALMAQEVSTGATVAVTPPEFSKPKNPFQKFFDLFKKKKPKKLSKKQEIAALKEKQLALEEMIKTLSPALEEAASAGDPTKPGTHKQEMAEFSLHAIEESRFLSVYDSKNYYRTERQWSEASAPEPGRRFERAYGKKTVYGFHPFWMGQGYYEYNFEVYDRVAYFAYSVDPATGRSATRFPGHSFRSSAIVKKAAERTGGRCKVDLCVSSYGIGRNAQLFSEGWEERIDALVADVVDLVAEAGGDGVCIDFQQVPTGDSAKYVHLVRTFREKFNALSQDRYQITVVLPNYSRYFPYTMTAGTFGRLWQHADRFIVTGYSAFSALYEPGKDSLAEGIGHDALWNPLLVDDGINHYAMMTLDLEEGPASPERIIGEKLVLALAACEPGTGANDSLQVFSYSDLKLLKLDEGFLPAFQEKIAYATAKKLNGVAVWGMGYDNGTGSKDLQALLALFTMGPAAQDQAMLTAMERMIGENRGLALNWEFPVSDEEAGRPLPDVLKVKLPVPPGVAYETTFDREAVVIHHVVVLCLIIFLFFAIIGVIISLFYESVRESVLIREHIVLLSAYFAGIAVIILLKKLNVISNTIFLFLLGTLLGSTVPFFIRKRQRNAAREDRP